MEFFELHKAIENKTIENPMGSFFVKNSFHPDSFFHCEPSVFEVVKVTKHQIQIREVNFDFEYVENHNDGIYDHYGTRRHGKIKAKAGCFKSDQLLRKKPILFGLPYIQKNAGMHLVEKNKWGIDVLFTHLEPDRIYSYETELRFD